MPANPSHHTQSRTRPNDDVESLRNAGDEEKSITPLPKLQIGILLSALVAEPLTAHVMLPFIVQLIEETGVTHGDVGKVGYYSGLVESLFFFSEACMILQWGRISDRIGRRPVIITGLTGLVLSMLFFGLAHSFTAVVASRVIAGLLNGNIGVVKCMLGEVTDASNVTQVMGFIPMAWSLGNMLAPFVGGLLQHPYERIGWPFRGLFWRQNPYFLPCSLVAAFSCLTLVVTFLYLKETAPCKTSTHIPGPAPTECAPLLPKKFVKPPPPPPLRALFTPPVTTTITAYALFAIIDIAFIVLQPLVYASPVARGGLGMHPTRIGAWVGACGLANGVASTFCFAPLIRRYGTRAVALAGVAACGACFALFPFLNLLARRGACLWPLLTLHLVFGTLHPMTYGSIFIYLRAAASRSALGATNGLAQTSASIMRVVGPFGATALFAVSVERDILGGCFVYVVILAVTAVVAAVVARLPSKMWERSD